MMQQFEQWAASLAEVASLESLRGAIVGIEAADFLNHLNEFGLRDLPEINRNVKEALLPALGPLPFGLDSILRIVIGGWKSHGIRPLFVLSGLDVGKNDTRLAVADEAVRANDNAWDMYYNINAAASVECFGRSNVIPPEELFRFLQKVLYEESLEFLVAPYGAWAQLSYLYKIKAIDTIAGASEILLLDVPEIITNWNFKDAEFTWVKRRACMSDIGAVSSDVFIDACLLSGNALLPTFPVLDAQHDRKMCKPKHATEMIMQSMGRTGHSLITAYIEEPGVQRMNYLDRFRRARLALKHHVVLTVDGKVEPFDVEHAPGDIHEVIGQRLPEELYFYLSKGVIGPRVLNWRTSGEILELPPTDNGDSEYYHTLVREQLNDIRASAIALLSNSLHRFWMHHDIHLKCWFDRNNSIFIDVREFGNPVPLIKDWNVHESVYGPVKDQKRCSTVLGTCVRLLDDPVFAKSSMTWKNPEKLLKTKEELLYNTIWRFLHIRSYINSEHNLTPWGKALYAAIVKLPETSSGEDANELEEAVLIAMEMARLDLLNAKNMHETYLGAPYRGSQKVRDYTLLISRISSLAKLKHQQIGYTGPLSRNYLGYHSMINAVRASLRDLAEISLTTLLLNSDADRDRTDFVQLGLELPFVLQNNCGLALAVNTYLDAVGTDDSLPTSAQKEAEKVNLRVKFPYTEDYAANLEKAFRLWDAVYAGVKAAGDLFKQRTLFDEADAWLSQLR